MTEERRRRWSGARNRGGCGFGCASVVVVLTVGLLLSLFNAAIGIGVSARVPLTDVNLTIAGSVGKKDKAADVLPAYMRGRLGGNQNFINQSTTLTIWVAEGTTLIVVGRQQAAPLIDLHVEAR
jgi:hypothetical protein